MTTARDIVDRAFRKIGVVADDEAMTAEQAQAGEEALNMMMHAWLLDGIDVAHVDITLGEVFPLLPQFHEGTVYLLAERLAPGYMRPVTFNPMEFMRKLQAAYLIVPDVQMPSAIRSTASQHRWRR